METVEQFFSRPPSWTLHCRDKMEARASQRIQSLAWGSSNSIVKERGKNTSTWNTFCLIKRTIFHITGTSYFILATIFQSRQSASSMVSVDTREHTIVSVVLSHNHAWSNERKQSTPTRRRNSRPRYFQRHKTSSTIYVIVSCEKKYYKTTDFDIYVDIYVSMISSIENYVYTDEISIL